MLLADGDILKADAYARKDVIDFWGFVYEYQERLKRKIHNISRSKIDSDASRD